MSAQTFFEKLVGAAGDGSALFACAPVSLGLHATDIQIIHEETRKIFFIVTSPTKMVKSRIGALYISAYTGGGQAFRQDFDWEILKYLLPSLCHSIFVS